MRILLTGGSACGKSTYAEKLAIKLKGSYSYISAMKPVNKEEKKQVINKRIQLEKDGFHVIDCYTNISSLDLTICRTIILECLCHLVANEMFDIEGAKEQSIKVILDGITTLEKKCENIIIVTNDVASEIESNDPIVIDYIKTLGEVNNKIANNFENVYELCCGIPIVLKGKKMVIE